nr:hypothetical protein [Microcystis flos-aquae]
MNAQKIPRLCGLKIRAITPYSLATAIAGGARIANPDLPDILLSREAQLFVGWVSGSVTHAGVGFHASTQPTFILYLIPPTHLILEQPPFIPYPLVRSFLTKREET